MIGIAGSIISPNKTAANQRSDAFNFPQAGSRAEANPGNGHAAHSHTAWKRSTEDAQFQTE